MGQETNKETRLHKVAKELNVGVNTIVEFLNKREGLRIDNPNPNSKINAKQYDLLVKEFSSDIMTKKMAEKQTEMEKERKKAISAESKAKKQAEKQNNGKTNENTNQSPQTNGVKVLGKIDLDQNKNKNNKSGNSSNPQNTNNSTQNQTKVLASNDNTPKETKESQGDTLKVLGKIDLDSINTKMRPDKKNKQEKRQERQQRQREQQQKQQQQKNAAQNQQKNLESQQTQVSSSNNNKNEETKNTTDTENIPEEIFRPNSTILPGPKILGKMDVTKLSAENENLKNDKNGRRRRTRRKGSKVDTTGNDFGQNSPNDKNNNNNGNNNNNNNKYRGKQNQNEYSSSKEQDSERKQNNKQDHRDNLRPDKPSKNDKKEQGRNNKRKEKDRWKAFELSEEEINKTVKETSNVLSHTKGKTFASKRRRDKRDDIQKKEEEKNKQLEKEKKILKLTEFLSANELAALMDVPVSQIISICMDELDLMVSINQRLDAEVMELIAGQLGFEVKFVDHDEEDEETAEDNPEDLQPRPPIVTIMGHVDHGKTSLLDYIRNTNVIAGEAGGITQHIGAYNVTIDKGEYKGQQITFLDTPGHAAFTAMRARGAKITDIVVIVIAADDNIMPQTEEALSHAQAAGVPIIFAINKIDKPDANPEKIKEALANKNFLVEDWGGDYGSVEISAKKGINVDLLLDRILLQAELLNLKANYKRPAVGTVLESTLDIGRGYTNNIIVENGILRVGDAIWIGSHSGKVRAMFNERGNKITEVKPSEPAVILGIDGAPAAGEKFKVMPNERAAREKATQRAQQEREIADRTKKLLDLEEISRRIAIGNFQELNLIIKGDVQGSIEALESSFEQLSTPEIEVHIIAKGVGQISENDILLAKASNALIIGFQVRPSSSAKKLAEKERISIKLYSVIYDAIDDVKAAMEGMLAPDVREEISGTAEVQQTFKISKVGTIAGCLVKEGKIIRTNKCRVIRDGIVIHTGELESLKHFKDDAKEAVSGTECGLNVKNFNDIHEGDIIESFEEKKVARTLK